MKDKTTNELQQILNKTNPKGIGRFLEENKASMYGDGKAFSEYMRTLLKEKHMTQQEVFTRAVIPERYGYKIISGEKKTLQRDVILRLCIAAGMSLKETQTALTLYGMSVLYPKFRRDAVLIIAINQGTVDIDKTDELLEEYGFDKLVQCGAE